MVRRIQVAILAEAGLFRQALCRRPAVEGEIEVPSAAATVYELLTRRDGGLGLSTQGRTLPCTLRRDCAKRARRLAQTLVERSAIARELQRR